MPCVSCLVGKVEIKKHVMCKKCYGKKYRTGEVAVLKSKQGRPPAYKIPNTRKDSDADYKPLSSLFAEMAFVKSFFDHEEWIPQPAKFTFKNGDSYRPDFYDMKRCVFIEIIGTRQAYHKNKHKYDLLKKEYPLAALELRLSSGDLLE